MLYAHRLNATIIELRSCFRFPAQHNSSCGGGSYSPFLGALLHVRVLAAILCQNISSVAVDFAHAFIETNTIVAFDGCLYRALSFIVAAGWMLVFVKINNVVDLCHNNAKTTNLSYNRIRVSSTLLLDLELSFPPDSPLHNSRPH